MSIEATPASIEKWKALTEYQKGEAVAWAAAHLNRSLKKYRSEIGRGVRWFASGHRESRPDRRKASKLLDEPVLIAYVKEKWTRADEREAKPEDWIPKWIKLSIPIPNKPPREKSQKSLENALFDKPDAGRRSRWDRRTVAVPVDVSEEGTASADAAPDDQRVFVWNESLTGGLKGTVCAYVKRRKAGHPGRYLLTCHHVGFRSKLDPMLAADRKARIFSGTEASPSQTEIGSPAGFSRLKRGKKNQLDAGLIELNAAGDQLARSNGYWRVHPDAWVRSRDAWIQFIQQSDPKPTFTLHPWGNKPKLKLRYLGREENRVIKYNAHAIAAIKEVFVFRCSGGATVPGYSGSPITFKTHNKIGLAGMHIAGGERGGHPASYAVPAYWMFRKNVLTKQGLNLAR